MTTLQEFVLANADALVARAAPRLRPRHEPGMPTHPKLAELLRKPIGPQADLVTAAALALRAQKDVTLATEMSTGKSFLATAICHCLGARRVLVACPPHLVAKWRREIEATAPGAAVTTMAGGKAWLSFATESHHVDRADDLVRQVPVQPGPLLPDRGQRRPGEQVQDAPPGTQPGRDRGVPPRRRGLRGDQDGGCRFLVAPATSLKLTRGGVSPARLVKRRLKNYFDVVILDESHQLKAAGTRAGQAAHHLIAAARKVVLLTGTLTAGRADDLFPTLYRLAPGRLKAHGYGHQDATKFAQKYGRIETRVTTTHQPGRARPRVVSRKAVRPGVMPGLFGDLLADRVLFLSLRDLGAHLPEHDEQAVPVALAPAMAAEYARMAAALLAKFTDLVKRDGRAAMRFLAPVAEALLTWPDDPAGWKTITAEGLPVYRPQDVGPPLAPKEERLRHDVAAEVSRGRQVWVFATRDRVGERLARVLAPYAPLRLTPAVPPLHREAWIREHGPQTHVVISHPKLVETGLELFGPGYNFSTLLWSGAGHELNVVRQASARHWRLGQTQVCRTRYYYYQDTAQEVALKLMAKKLAAATFLEGRTVGGGLLDEDEDGRLDLAVVRHLADALLKRAA